MTFLVKTKRGLRVSREKPDGTAPLTLPPIGGQFGNMANPWARRMSGMCIHSGPQRVIKGRNCAVFQGWSSLPAHLILSSRRQDDSMRPPCAFRKRYQSWRLRYFRRLSKHRPSHVQAIDYAASHRGKLVSYRLMLMEVNYIVVYRLLRVLGVMKYFRDAIRSHSRALEMPNSGPTGCESDARNLWELTLCLAALLYLKLLEGGPVNYLGGPDRLVKLLRV
ncbi:hypothetical protein BJ170DRAFT_716042 [Xylariales sp. AK1849]|nr:hypothetical protein BJ170DRAFT_716042 [Xylariales sp. AK1849]